MSKQLFQGHFLSIVAVAGVVLDDNKNCLKVWMGLYLVLQAHLLGLKVGPSLGFWNFGISAKTLYMTFYCVEVDVLGTAN